MYCMKFVRIKIYFQTVWQKSNALHTVIICHRVWQKSDALHAACWKSVTLSYSVAEAYCIVCSVVKVRYIVIQCGISLIHCVQCGKSKDPRKRWVALHVWSYSTVRSNF